MYSNINDPSVRPGTPADSFRPPSASSSPRVPRLVAAGAEDQTAGRHVQAVEESETMLRIPRQGTICKAPDIGPQPVLARRQGSGSGFGLSRLLGSPPALARVHGVHFCAEELSPPAMARVHEGLDLWMFVVRCCECLRLEGHGKKLNGKKLNVMKLQGLCGCGGG